MTRVSVLPFVLGIGAALLLFAAWLPFAVTESRRPYRWRATPPPLPARRELPPKPQLVAVPPSPAGSAPVVAPRQAATPKASTPKISTPKISTPKISTPKISTPKISTPKVSTPKVSTPKRPRGAVVVVAFTVWSLWSLRNHGDHR